MLAAKVQTAVTKLNESKKIAKKVDDYLDLYVESVLPKKTIVDYEKMQKLERIQESLQDLLLVNTDSIAKKKEKLDESFKQQRSKCETEVAKMQVKLNESMAKTRELKRKLDQFKALDLLESKTKDLPSFEAN
nr:MAG TPA: large tegument protein UL36 [Caudoviricetes sp.]